jgi:hypothetical protein
MIPSGPRSSVTVRSVALGLIGVSLICAITPFNNYVANNTDTIGSALPTVVVFLLLIIALLNGLLGKFAPRAALRRGELAVALAMVLVGCALPAVGLMRYLPGHLVSYHALPASLPPVAEAFRAMDLPDWLWPAVDMTSETSRASDPVIVDFMQRVPASDASLLEQIRAVPWSAWARPALAWGLFFSLLFAAVIFLSLIFRHQWVENERLPFPLASVYLSLIEPPAPGRALNRLFASKLFWLTFAAVFVAHGINGLHAYDTEHWPEMPLRFDLGRILSERPWSFVEGAAKSATVYFTVIGIVYFADTRVALSVWLMFMMLQVFRMFGGPSGVEVNGSMQADQGIGGAAAFAVAIIWIARRHLADVARQMFRRRREAEPRGRYLPYGLAGWGLIACLGGLVCWLTLAGASAVGAVVIVTVLTGVYLVLAKVVAETGLVYVLIPMDIRRIWMMAGQDMPTALAGRTTLGSWFYSSFFSGVLLHDVRQALPVYAIHGMRINDEEGPDRAGAATGPTRRSQWSVIAVMGLALVVAFFVSGAGMLWAEYAYAASLTRVPEAPMNSWGAQNMARDLSMGTVVDYVSPKIGPREGHNRLGHVAFGAAMVAGLSMLRLRFVAWPLHPVGFLLVYTWGIQQIWFSVLLGWLAKTTLIRLGGSSLFMAAKPAFLGLIVGEATAATFWLIVTLVRLAMGEPYETIRLLPA